MTNLSHPAHSPCAIDLIVESGGGDGRTFSCPMSRSVNGDAFRHRQEKSCLARRTLTRPTAVSNAGSCVGLDCEDHGHPYQQEENSVFVGRLAMCARVKDGFIHVVDHKGERWLPETCVTHLHGFSKPAPGMGRTITSRQANSRHV